MAQKRSDAASLRHLANALEATHLSLRKKSPDFEAHYRSVQAAAAAQKSAAKEAAAQTQAHAPVPAPPAQLRPGSCPPQGMAAWAAHFEERERCVQARKAQRSARVRRGRSAQALSWRYRADDALPFFLSSALRMAPSAARARWTCRGR